MVRLPSQSQGLSRCKVVPRHGDRDVGALLVPEDLVGGERLRPALQLLDCAAAEERRPPVAHRDGHVPGRAGDVLAPVVVLEETAAETAAAEAYETTGLDGRGELAGESREPGGVVFRRALRGRANKEICCPCGNPRETGQAASSAPY